MILHDSLEDLRGDLGGAQRALESVSAQLRRASDDARADERARGDTFQARLDKLARDLETRIQSAQSGIENAAAQRETHTKLRLASISESLASGQNAFQTAIAEALDASTRRVEERLATTEARLADAMRVLDVRESEMERRWEARMSNMESRILSELGAITGLFTRDEPASANPSGLPARASHARRHPRPTTE